MKKRILTICIAILTVALCFLCAACSSGADYAVKETSLREGGKSASEIVKEICAQYPERTMGNGNDYRFLGYLAGEMTSYGYPVADFPDSGEEENGEGGSQGGVILSATSDNATVEVKSFTFKNMYTNSTETGYNLVYRVPAAEESEDEVLLLASYDNCAGIEVSSQDLSTGKITTGKIGGEGAYSNATGVAVLLRVAYELADRDLPYNLTIAFVDCSENGWEGAEEIAKTFDGKSGNFICLNFNKLGLGDYTYVYSDEVAQDYNDYFYSVIKKTDDGGVFADIPLNKQIAEVRFIDAQKTEYSHFAMYGDNLIFNVHGLAVASYVSFNWSAFDNPFYTENKGYENLLGTSADTYGNLIERLGGGEKGEKMLSDRLNAVVLNAVTAVSEDNADTLMSEVGDSDPGYSGGFAESASVVSLVVKIVLVAVAVGIAIWLTVKGRGVLVTKQKQKLEQMRSEAESGANAGPVPAEDVFSMGRDKRDGNDNGKNNKSGGDGGDDVFEGF